MILDVNKAILLLIDIQERLTPVMAEPREVIQTSEKLLMLARILDVPVLVTEQVPEKIGQTMADLRDKYTEQTQVIFKTTFSSCKTPAFMDALKASGRQQVIVAGIESHVCVLQTVLDLLAGGFDVMLVEEGLSSRNARHKAVALQRMQCAGAQVCVFEMVAFELVEDSADPIFRNVLPLIK
jgi:nicotinamidase-related amidase